MKCVNMIELCFCTGALRPQQLPGSPTASTPSTQLQLQSYKLVGDNIDKCVRAQYIRFESGHDNKSLHYFHYFAVLNRIDFMKYLSRHTPLYMS